MPRLNNLIVAFIAFLFCAIGQSNAADRIDVCAEYNNTGAQYHVEATIIKGRDLNTATRSFDYNGLSTYAVIFWAEGQASIIEFDLFLGSLGIMGNDGIDQSGKQWNIRKYSPITCN